MKIKQVRAKDLLRALLKAGFIIKRKEGSHIFLQKGNHYTSISIHSGNLPKGTLRAILRQTELSDDELKEYLR